MSHNIAECKYYDGGVTVVTYGHTWQRYATVIDMKAEPTVVLSFRLPQRLVKRIDAYAEKETRNRANMVQVLLQEALIRREEELQDAGRK